MSQDKKAESSPPSLLGADMETILAQWQHERPDIDPRPMAVCGNIWRAAEILRQGVLENLKDYGFDITGFDVILTLRRQGRGKALSPSALSKEMMLSTSAMTNRLDRLEKRSLIQRIPDPNDRRGLKIVLTKEGFNLADEMVASHVKTEKKMLSLLTDAEQETIRILLNKIGTSPDN